MEIITPGTQTVFKVILQGRRSWSSRELTSYSGLSLGTVTRATQFLTRAGLVRRNRENRLVVTNPKKLEDMLLAATDLHASVSSAWFLPLTPKAISAQISKLSESAQLPYAFTGPLGLWILYKHVPPTDAYMYIARRDGYRWRESLKQLGAVRASPFNANLFVVETSDPYVFRQAVRVDSLLVAPEIQVYLDCMSIGGRVAEGARELWSKTSGSFPETSSK